MADDKVSQALRTDRTDQLESRTKASEAHQSVRYPDAGTSLGPDSEPHSPSVSFANDLKSSYGEGASSVLKYTPSAGRADKHTSNTLGR